MKTFGHLAGAKEEQELAQCGPPIERVVLNGDTRAFT